MIVMNKIPGLSVKKSHHLLNFRECEEAPGEVQNPGRPAKRRPASCPRNQSRSGSNESCHPVKSKVETRSPPVSFIKCHSDHRLPEFSSALPVPHSLRSPQGLTGDILDCQVRVWLQARVNAMFVYTSRVALVIPVKIVKYHCLSRTILSRNRDVNKSSSTTLSTALGKKVLRAGTQF